jgi:hypothetical protein
MCSPSLTFLDVTASVDIASGNVTALETLGPLGSHVTSLQQFSNNVTGDPLDGRAYNGMFFELDSPDLFVEQRQNAIQLSLPAAVFQAAQNSADGLTAAFQNNQFANLSTIVYVSNFYDL